MGGVLDTARWSLISDLAAGESPRFALNAT